MTGILELGFGCIHRLIGLSVDDRQWAWASLASRKGKSYEELADKLQAANNQDIRAGDIRRYKVVENTVARCMYLSFVVGMVQESTTK